jgi:hypothetical protein
MSQAEPCRQEGALAFRRREQLAPFNAKPKYPQELLTGT